ncbi:MAG: flagellar motor switch protein FliN [Chitinispirillia bacterium]|jgi:flagellar motor switch protein FliN/FliY
MSDFLSQDQIDDLLKQQEAAGVDSISDDSDTGVDSKKEYDALTEAFDLFCLQAGTVISTLLSRDISFSISQCNSLVSETLQNSVTAPLLVISIPIEGALSGNLFFIMGTKDVAILSDLMMMGDGSAEYTEDHKDAIGELFNQILGSYTTSLGEHCGDSVSAGSIEVKEFDFSNPEIPVEGSDMVILDASIPEIVDSTLGIVIPGEFSAQFMEKFKKSQDLGGDIGGGLSSSEIDDLSQISSDIDDSDDSFQESSMVSTDVKAPKENINMLLDVEMDVCIELGRADLSIKRILELAPGSIVELDRMAGEPVDLMVNNKVVAKGEVVVVEENFGIRIVSLVSPEERIKSLR